jgi:hypothetical protein
MFTVLSRQRLVLLASQLCWFAACDGTAHTNAEAPRVESPPAIAAPGIASGDTFDSDTNIAGLHPMDDRPVTPGTAPLIVPSVRHRSELGLEKQGNNKRQKFVPLSVLESNSQENVLQAQRQVVLEERLRQLENRNPHDTLSQRTARFAKLKQAVLTPSANTEGQALREPLSVPQNQRVVIETLNLSPGADTVIHVQGGPDWSFVAGNDDIAAPARHNNNGVFAGAAYVFVRAGSTWSQQAYIKASNTNSDDHFGMHLAIENNKLVVGAEDEDSTAVGLNGNQNNNAGSLNGAVYLFGRNGGTWSQRAYLKASNSNPYDVFGGSVALSGNTIAVGAEGEDSNAKGINGNQLDNSAANSGAVYVFKFIPL